MQYMSHQLYSKSKSMWFLTQGALDTAFEYQLQLSYDMNITINVLIQYIYRNPMYIHI